MESRRSFAQEVRAALDAEAPAPVHAAHAELADELELVLAQAERAESSLVEVTLPSTLSATQTLALVADEEAFVRDLARPMPRRPSTAARFGTAFHAWVESHYEEQRQEAFFDPDDLPGRADVDIEDDAELADLRAAFASGPYARREPFSIEEAFSIQLGAQRLIGRIDAVFPTRLADGTDGFEIVDWKTNRRASADPLQLAVYRLAWAEQHDIDPAQVVGSFHYVRLGETVTYDDLPGRAQLERLLAGES